MNGSGAFGTQLRDWRKSRSKSQLELSGLVGYSQRHLSFLESGRSNPSRVSVLALCDALEVPLRDRNPLLIAAGFAPAYPTRTLDGSELGAILSGLETVIECQPFPTLLVDDAWNLVRANSASLRFFNTLLGDLSGLAGNVLEACFDDAVLKPCIKDWPVVAASFLGRLRRDAANDPGNTALAELIERLAQMAGPLDQVPAPEPANSPVQTLTFLQDGLELTFFSLIASIGRSHDIVLAGLHMETFVPADQTTRAAMDALND